MKNRLLPLFFLLPAAANARQGEGLHYSCRHERSRIELSLLEPKPESAADKDETEWIDPSDLVEYGNIEGRSEVRRIGSIMVTKQCGELTLTVSGGFYNANPEGELGAMEDYPIVEILDAMGNTTGPMAMGSCDPTSPRYSYMVQCPQDWIVDAAAFNTKAGVSVHVNHQYEEYRQPIKAKAPPQTH